MLLPWDPVLVNLSDRVWDGMLYLLKLAHIYVIMPTVQVGFGNTD